MTAPVPGEYFQPCDRAGSVVEFRYETPDRNGGGETVEKTAYVYLPYGYDEGDARYDIVYLMHGWGGHAGEYFEMASIKEMLDQMVERGDTAPTIFVSPTFYTPAAGTDFSSSEAALRVFHEEFEQDLMPAVESAFRTYATDATPAGLAASRDHRAFGGFSLGSVTTWLEFCHDYDYIRWFLPMSGACWYYGTYGNFQTERNVDFIGQLVSDNDLNERGYFVYFTTGTDDAVKSQSIAQADEMLARGAFSSEHFVFYQKDGGQHDHYAVREYLYNALPLFFAQAGEGAMTTQASAPFTVDTPIQEVVDYPAFAGFGRLIFPVNQGYCGGSTLGDLSLTWYSGIRPERTVEVCNHLKDRAEAGDAIFIDIYTDEEKAADPWKADTGLFFFRGEPGARTAIVSAGGGFSYVGAMHDSFPHALELSKLGYNAFALIYRPSAQTACEDLARAIAYLHEHADELGISMEGYSLWGGSAGARMAAWLGSRGAEAFGEAAYPRPAACIVNYTGLSVATGDEPPTYSAVGTADGIASYRTMQDRIARIQANGTPAEIEVFDGLPHGFGLGEGTIAEGWLDHAVKFWEANMS